MKLVSKKTTSKSKPAKTAVPHPQRILFWNLTREDIDQLLLTVGIVLLCVGVVYLTRGLYNMSIHTK